MKTSRLILTAAMVVAALTTTAMGEIPPPPPNWATIAYEGEVSVFTTLNGNGDPLNACRAETTPPGQTVDATITIEALHPYTQEPIVGYPAEDFWLETSLGGFVQCPGGSQADGPTDENGFTYFTLPVIGGGHSNRSADELTFVYANGDPAHPHGFALRFNSADINGDLRVTLDDVVLFSQMYNSGEYHYAVDLYFDGRLSLSDIIYFSQSRNTLCD